MPLLSITRYKEDLPNAMEGLFWFCFDSYMYIFQPGRPAAESRDLKSL